MILLSNSIKAQHPEAFRKAASERIRAVRLESDLWYCARRAPGHGRYLVRFFVTPSVDGNDQVRVECRDIDGVACRGCWRGGMCAHIAKAILAGVRHGTRKLKQEAA